jgi:hypothetical protein
MTITLTREEAQSVLDALEGVKDMAWDSDTVAGRKLIKTLRARLSAPEPDYRDVVIKGDLWRIEFLPDHAASVVLVRANYEAQPEPEPVAWLHSFTGYGWQVVPEKLYPTDQPLYTAPPQREWQDLTKQEFIDVTDGLEDLEDCWIQLQAKLKEKNT